METKASRLVVEVEISSGMRVKLQAKSCVVVGKNEIENSQVCYNLFEKEGLTPRIK